MDGGCVYEKNSRGLMAHKETKSNPLVLHTAGKFFDCFSWIASQLELKEPTMRSLTHPFVRTSTRQLQLDFNYQIPPPEEGGCSKAAKATTDTKASKSSYDGRGAKTGKAGGSRRLN